MLKKQATSPDNWSVDTENIINQRYTDQVKEERERMLAQSKEDKEQLKQLQSRLEASLLETGNLKARVAAAEAAKAEMEGAVTMAQNTAKVRVA